MLTAAFVILYLVCGFASMIFTAWWTKEPWQRDDLFIMTIIGMFWPVSLVIVGIVGLQERNYGRHFSDLINKLAGY